MTGAAGDEPTPRIEEFVDGRTDSADDWQWLWEGDRRFPIHSHRGFLGKLLVLCKRLLRPLVTTPQADLWERQRRFNLTLLHRDRALREQFPDQVAALAARTDEIFRDLTEVRNDLLQDVQQHARRLAHLEEFKRQGLDDVTRHSDALFSRVDQKFDRYRRQSRELWSKLGGLLSALDTETGSAAELVRAHDEMEYVDLEHRFRGLESDIADRLAVYQPFLEGRGEILDLGCGRGEALEVLAGFGLPVRGVDSSAEMVRACRDKGLRAAEGDLFERLAAEPEGSLGGVVSFHVIEHLPAPSLGRLVSLAWRALAPGGVLILETPNPESMVVSARNFWIDPTHRRPVHPAMLAHLYEQAGLERVERLELRQFGEGERLPEVATADLPEEQQALAHQVNVLRDRIDTLLFGFQDYAVIGVKP